MTHKIPKNRILLLPKINSEAKKKSQVINISNSNSLIYFYYGFWKKREWEPVGLEEKDDELVSNILRVPIGSKASCKADHSIWYALRMDMLDSNPRAKGGMDKYHSYWVSEQTLTGHDNSPLPARLSIYIILLPFCFIYLFFYFLSWPVGRQELVNILSFLLLQIQ